MPEFFREGPYRFFCYAHDLLHEPPHVHVERDTEEAKFWLDPISLEYNNGFPRHELRRVQGIIEDQRARLLKAWNDATP